MAREKGMIAVCLEKKTIKTLGDWRERFLEKIYRLADPRKPMIAQKLNSYLVV